MKFMVAIGCVGMLSLGLAHAAQLPEHKNSDGLGERPAAVQKAVDTAFEELNKGDKEWGYRGSDAYHLMNIDDEKLVLYIARRKGMQDVLFMDVGCGDGTWGQTTMLSILGDEQCKKSGKKFSIVSITGSNECEPREINKDHVSLYQFNGFKIEDIQSELTKKGLDLAGKADLIVSNWTHRHLVDAWGTLGQEYDLLKSDGGFLLSSGFLFNYAGEKDIQGFPLSGHLYNSSILAYSTAITIFGALSDQRNSGDFLLQRRDGQKLTIPLRYSGEVVDIPYGYQCASRKVTSFNKEAGFSPKNFKAEFLDKKRKYSSQKIYCAQGNEQSKALYEELKKNGVIA